MPRTKPVTKDYVKKAIEAKRDVLSECALKQSSLPYDNPFIYNVTPNNVIVQGQGQDIDFHNLDITLGIYGGDGYVRLMVVQWFQDSTLGIPTLDDLLCTTPSQFSYADGYKKGTLHQKFVVVRDQLIARDDDPTQNAGKRTAVKMKIRKKELQRKVLRSTGTGQFKNNLYLVAFSDRPSTNSSVPSMNIGITYQFKSRD